MWSTVVDAAGPAAAVIAIPALWVAWRSKREAEKANQTATDALAVARDANDHAARAEARETERHDVHWDGDWEQPGVYRLFNIGTDSAHKVRATVTVDGVSSTAESPLVEGTSSLVLEFPSARQTYMQERLEDQRGRQDAARARQSNPWGIGDYIPDVGRFMHLVDVRVVWETALGQPKEQFEEKRDALGPWED